MGIVEEDSYCSGFRQGAWCIVFRCPCQVRLLRQRRGNANAKLIFFTQALSDYDYVQEAFTYPLVVDAALDVSLECTWTSPICYAD
jgi:hypothetical protein